MNERLAAGITNSRNRSFGPRSGRSSVWVRRVGRSLNQLAGPKFSTGRRNGWGKRCCRNDVADIIGGFDSTALVPAHALSLRRQTLSRQSLRRRLPVSESCSTAERSSPTVSPGSLPAFETAAWRHPRRSLFSVTASQRPR